MTIDAGAAYPVFVPGAQASTGLAGGPQQPDMSVLVTNPFAFWQQKAVLRVFQNDTATTIPDSGSAATVIFDSVSQDNYSGYDLSTGEYTAQVTGWYHVTVTVAAAPQTSNLVALLQAYVQTNYANWRVAGVPLCNSSSVPTICAGSYVVYLTAGLDYVSCGALLQNASSTVNTRLTAQENSHMDVMWLMG